MKTKTYMPHFILASILLVLGASDANAKDKSGLTLSSGSMFTDVEGSSTSQPLFDISVTTSSGVILGTMRTKPADWTYSATNWSTTGSISHEALYVGYEWDNGYRLTAGSSKVTEEWKYQSNDRSNVDSGWNVGFHEVYSNGVMFGSRILIGDNTQVSLELGYKF